jgi:hypothetical protein
LSPHVWSYVLSSTCLLLRPVSASSSLHLDPSFVP